MNTATQVNGTGVDAAEGNARGTDGPDRRADIEAIEQVVAAVEHAQRNELPDAFVSLFREDAIWTTGHGRRLVGRDEISEFTHRVLPGAMRDMTATYEVVHVLFVRPDVAAVKVRQRYATLDGRPVEGGREGSPLYVMAREDGRWLLTACQNTEVTEE
ncbi:SgcJ/EcaC family oxidoreductase [Streptomyces sp. BV286]|uniref:SgcJ/EcaC family oxidoreductase n=1 Tax=Streptomyces sp. BV286 TaxID=2849672 RepID=UPI001C2E288F|nr:SgcJ/EcaC family oxidoreductase [Streptomyces sp. BV286]MBV1937840.1 SgcJ/EcaC family oxidoreductase [Streptomyces sp. BV286]